MKKTTRIDKVFVNLRAANKKALIPYIMAGDPRPNATVGLMHDLVAHGADIIELGLPFSDPMADGPVISAAGERALAAGTSTYAAIAMVKEFRKNNQETPVLLMGYLNPIEIIGYDGFVELCQDAGVDALLMVDFPPHEAKDFADKLTSNEQAMNLIFLLSPTTLPERREQVVKHCSGFIYYVSLKGVTGSSNLDIDEVGRQLDIIRSETDLPVCVGFGIRDGQSAKALGEHADGVIIGSELVKNFANVQNNADFENARLQLLAKMDELRQALDS